VEAAFQKFGVGIWELLVAKYPGVDVGKFAPTTGNSIAKSSAFAFDNDAPTHVKKPLSLADVFGCVRACVQLRAGVRVFACVAC
jgi:hypothetical protein